MFPDDRVLIGVLNRKRDLQTLLKSRWYRIPQKRLPRGVYTEYLAFYISGSAARGLEQSGIHYYAQVRGVELLYRRDLLPDEPDHRNANETYYKVQLSELSPKLPVVTNPTRRPISFVFTTWDRFVNARTIPELYSKADYYVDRIYHALKDRRLRPERTWDAQKREYGYGAAVRVICENGIFTGYTETQQATDGGYYLDPDRDQDEMLREIVSRIERMGGPVTLPTPPVL